MPLTILREICCACAHPVSAVPAAALQAAKSAHGSVCSAKVWMLHD